MDHFQLKLMYTTLLNVKVINEDTLNKYCEVFLKLANTQYWNDPSKLRAKTFRTGLGTRERRMAKILITHTRDLKCSQGTTMDVFNKGMKTHYK